MYTMITNRNRHNRPMMPSLLDDRFFRPFFDMPDFGPAAGFRVDVKENDTAYILSAELPGVKQEDIAIDVADDVLTISAELNAEKKADHENYIYSERRSGRMSRSFSLEGIRQDAISADYTNGVLTLTLPKDVPAEKAARRITIGSGSAEAPQNTAE